MKKNLIDIAIIGGGASGLCAAIQAKRKNKNLSVTIFEHLNRIGKKILVTGNGRCNLTNLDAENHAYRNKNFCDKIFEKFGVNYTLDFFKSLGLYTIADSEKRVYPRSNTASSVLDCLRFEAEKLGVEIICDTHIETIEKTNGIFLLNKTFLSRKVILATGGKSAKAHGSDGSGYQILKSFGLNVIRPEPSLVPLKTEGNIPKQLKGIRAQVTLSLFEKQKNIFNVNGEILFADYGISGIAAMETGSYISDSKRYTLLVDFLPDFSCENLEKIISQSNASTTENCLIGLLPKKLGQIICKQSSPDCLLKNPSSLDKKTVEKIVKNIKEFSFIISGTRGFENAQVTRGGADVSEFKNTLESKKITGLYCVGELLDVDGGCGGFNLQWAWSSGLAAGHYASEGK